MATITRGYSFGATETVTNTKLHTLVDSATLSAIQQTDIDANLGLVHVATSAPSDTDMLWKNTNTSPATLMIHNATTWVPVTEYDLLTNKSGQTATAGQVVIIDTSNSNAFKYTSTKGDALFAGIVKESISNNASGVVLGRGFDINVLLEISASAGSFLRTSSATGKAENVAAGTSNVFGIVQAAGTASAEAYVFGGINPSFVLPSASASWQSLHTTASGASLTDASLVFGGGIVQIQRTNITTLVSGSTTMAIADTIPVNTEGFEVVTVSITPKATANRLLIEFMTFGNAGTNISPIVGAIFQDSTANALYAIASANVAPGSEGFILFGKHEMAAGTTSATTFKLRVGSADANTVQINAADNVGGDRSFGGVAGTYIMVTEYVN